MVLPWALVTCTVVIWATRIRNILDDGADPVALLVAGGLTALALATAFALRTGRFARAPHALVVATVGVWAVRAPLVLVHDHPGAFKAVHLALATVSVALALGAWRAVTTAAVPEGRNVDVARS
ncbi:MAG: hypothetical protein M3R01_01345 [Actinomycetota bacterium]|nr:hypothetical protein [Actinomycetota bacterium]